MPITHQRTRRALKINIAAALLALMGASGAEAADEPTTGSYQLIEGFRNPVCLTYQRFLQATQTQAYQRTYLEPAKRSLECDRLVPPDHTELSQPQWTSLRPQEHFELLTRVEEYFQVPLNEEATIPRMPYSEANPLSINLAGIRLELASVDIDNDGTAEPVLRFRDDATCRSAQEYRTGGWSAPLLVLSSDLKRVDVRRTAPLMRNPNKQYIANRQQIDRAVELRRKGANVEVPPVVSKPTEYAAGETSFRSYDLFAFNGRVYFDRWIADPRAADYRHLSVFRLEDGAARKECELVFQDTTQPR